MTLCAYNVDCVDVLDLTDPVVRADHGIALADLACAWKDLATRGKQPPSWALALRLAAGGVAGVLVPSFASRAGPSDINAVFWRWADVTPHQVRVIDDMGRLPKNDQSWR